MIKHIVMFKLKEKNEANLEKALSALSGMEGRIESLLSLEVGVDFKESERSYDLVLTTSFADMEGLENYAAHPVHQPVLKLMRELIVGSVVVDYEC